MLLTVKQVAERWQVSERTVDRHIRAGTLPAINVGTGKHRLYRVAMDDVVAFESRGKKTPITYSPMKARKIKPAVDYLS